MKRTFFVAVAGLACLVAAVVIFGRGKAESEPAAERSLVDEVRWLSTDGGDPQAAIALAQQYLAANPELTIERQRVHFELAAAQRRMGDDEASLATFRQVISMYQALPFDRTSADYKADDALFYIAHLELGFGHRAEGLEAFTELIAQFPESDRRPQAMHALAYELAVDGQLEQGRALAEALAADYVGKPLEPQALHWAVVYLLGPEANPTDEQRAQNLPAAKAHVETLVARHPGARETAMALENLTWHLVEHDECAEGALVAQRIIELFAQAEPGVADSAMYSAGITEIEHGDRALGAAALANVIAKAPDADWRPDAIRWLACARARDGRLDEARALIVPLATEYANTPREAEILRLINLFLLGPDANPTKDARTQNLAIVGPLLERLTAKYPDAPETMLAHHDLLAHHIVRFKHAEAEPVARRLIELFPGTVSAAEARMELAEVIVELRREFAAGNELIDDAILWALDHGDIGREALFLWSKSRILVIEKRCGESRLTAQQVIGLAQTHEEARWLLMRAESQVAYGYFKEGLYQTAAGEFTRLIEQYPAETSWSPFLKYYVGLSYFRAGDKEQARDAFIRLVDEHPDNAWAYWAFQRMDLRIPKPDDLWSPPETAGTAEGGQNDA